MSIPAGIVVHWALGAFLILAWLLLSKRRHTLAPPAVSLLLVLAVALSAINSKEVNPWISLPAIVLAVFILHESFQRMDGKLRRHFAVGFLGMLLVGICLALWQNVFLGMSRANLWSFHPNIGSTHILIAIFGSMLYLDRKASRLGIMIIASAFVVGIFILVLTGSRSAIIGLLTGSAFLLVVAVMQHPARKRLVQMGLVISIGVAAAAAITVSFSSFTGSKNLLLDSDFQASGYPWQTLHGTEVIALGGANPNAPIEEANNALVLSKNRATTDGSLVVYQPLIPVKPGAPYILSFYVHPVANALEQTFIRIIARDSNDRRLARLTIDGWDTSRFSTPATRLHLPDDEHDWQRVFVGIPSLPPNTTHLSLNFMNSSSQLGTYGFMTAVQFEQARVASDYVPGGSLGPLRLLEPILPRLMQLLQDPVSASGGRISAYLLGLEYAASKPLFGHGLGASEGEFSLLTELYLPGNIVHAHSSYLQLLIDGGLFLLVTFIMCGASILVILYRQINKRSHAFAAVAAVGALIAVATQSALDSTWFHFQTLALLWFVLCLGIYTESANTRCGN